MLNEQQQSWSALGEILPGSGKSRPPAPGTGFRWKLTLLLLAALIVAAVQKLHAADKPANQGEFGADLALLASYFSGPENDKETNFYLDMWAGRQTARIARLNGLTNNKTLFINSHGMGGLGVLGNRYGFYPHQSLVQYKSPIHAPTFSVRDIATVMGPEKVAAVHNVVLSSCDMEGCFSAAEVKKHFPNVTNVVHTPQWQAGYQPMFYSAMVNPSVKIEPLYEAKIATGKGKAQYEVSAQPKPGARKLSPYVAELFQPDGKKPYRTVVAGRELLDPRGVMMLSQLHH